MRKSAGFTLIELVIVIVILGILGAVAAPKFLNLQGDAYSANVKSLAGSLQSATTLANTKAVLEGKDKGTVQAGDIEGYSTVEFFNGYPIASEGDSGILGALQSLPSGSDYDVKLGSTTPESLIIQPTARNDNSGKCFVRYTQAQAAVAAADGVDAVTAEPAKVEFDADCE